MCGESRTHGFETETGEVIPSSTVTYTNEPEVRLAFESLKYFQHWKEMVGGDCGFQPLGLLVFTPPEYPEHLEANLSMMRRIGVNTRAISPQDAQELDPSLWTGDVTQVAYEPESGYADPNATIYSLARASADLGVTFQFETEVTVCCFLGIESKESRPQKEPFWRQWLSLSPGPGPINFLPLCTSISD